MCACGRCGRGWHWRRRYLKPTTASRVKEVRYINQQRDPYAQTSSAPPLPHLHRVWAHPCHICPKTGAHPPTSPPGLGSRLPHLRLGPPLPHLHLRLGSPRHICTGTGARPCHICTGTRGAHASHPCERLGPPLPHLQCDLYMRPCPVLCGCKSPALLRLGVHSLTAANFRYNRTPAPETAGVLGFGTSTPRTADYVTPTPGVGARPE